MEVVGEKKLTAGGEKRDIFGTKLRQNLAC